MTLSKACVIRVAGSKSMSHRALVCAALAAGKSRIHGFLDSADTRRTQAVLQKCGVEIQEREGTLLVRGLGGAPKNTGDALRCDVGESGTSCRLLTAVLAAGQGSFEVFGAGRMHKRPIGGLVEPLRRLGAAIDYLEAQGCPPLRLSSSGLSTAALAGEALQVRAVESSQYLSALLLAAPLVRQGDQPLVIALSGEKAVSWPYVGMTLQAMKSFGAKFWLEALGEDGSWKKVEPQKMEQDFYSLALPGRLRFLAKEGPYSATDYQVEGDWSSASYFLAAGAIGPKTVAVEGLRPDSSQADRVILDVLVTMGASPVWKNGRVSVSPSLLTGAELNLEHAPDLVPTVMALAAHASGSTVVRGVEHLAYKESDRLSALADELGRAGCSITRSSGSLALTPPDNGPHAPGQGVFSAHGDHRIAMALALLGLPGLNGNGFKVVLDHPECVNKSNPDFWQNWRRVTSYNS